MGQELPHVQVLRFARVRGRSLRLSEGQRPILCAGPERQRGSKRERGDRPAARARKGAAASVAYSDWPGWTAFEVGIQKGWFKEAGVDVEFSWFDYLPSLDAFSSGKVDAVMATNGDALVTGASGAKSKMILLDGLQQRERQGHRPRRTSRRSRTSRERRSASSSRSSSIFFS